MFSCWRYFLITPVFWAPNGVGFENKLIFIIDVRTLSHVICVVLQEWYLDKDCRNSLHLSSNDNPRRIRMGRFLRNAYIPFCGGIPGLFCRVSGLRTHSIDSYSQIFAFQNFHIEIKPKGFVCNPCDTIYLSKRRCFWRRGEVGF